MSRPLYLMLALALTGCASSSNTFPRPPDLYHPPPEYTFAYDALFADLFWRCTTPQERGVRVEGYAVTSMRSNMGLLNFEVRLTARDAKGNTLADRWAYGDLLVASNIDPVPFEIFLPATDGVARYDLYYRFEIPDGNGNGQGRAPHRDERTRLVAATASGFIWFGTIEDVCGARYRRKEVPPES